MQVERFRDRVEVSLSAGVAVVWQWRALDVPVVASTRGQAAAECDFEHGLELAPRVCTDAQVSAHGGVIR
jgi:hypothetical protein